MITAKHCLDTVYVLSHHGNLDMPVQALSLNSHHVAQNTLFAAVKGVKTDGHAYISQAIAQGASVIVCETLPEHLHTSVLYVCVENTLLALAGIASNFYGNPSKKLKLMGITGTNGKTTTATLLHALFSRLGYAVGLISTVVNKIKQTEIPSTHTTPDVITLNALLADMVAEGCTYAFMEVSSHAAEQGRIKNLHFAGGVFSNLTRDHLDYHQTFKNYIYAKKKFFDDLPLGAFALVNLDDTNAMVMLQNTKASKHTYALLRMADFKTKILENNFLGLQLQLDDTEFWSPLVGSFNAYNLTAVYATAMLLGEDKQQVLAALSLEKNVDGRFDHFVSKTGIHVVVDYAHTPDALDNVLQNINQIRTRNEQLITVVGCGGERDKGKRPQMAAIATELSNFSIFTSDNPRSENPEDILKDMQAGVAGAHFSKYICVVNRAEAIKQACMLAQKNDIVLLAGKGHEKYQIAGAEVLPFDDKQVCIDILEKLNK